MFEFYKVFYQMGYLTKQDVHKACYWGVIITDEYKEIIGEDYTA